MPNILWGVLQQKDYWPTYRKNSQCGRVGKRKHPFNGHSHIPLIPGRSCPFSLSEKTWPDLLRSFHQSDNIQPPFRRDREAFQQLPVLLICDASEIIRPRSFGSMNFHKNGPEFAKSPYERWDLPDRREYPNKKIMCWNFSTGGIKNGEACWCTLNHKASSLYFESFDEDVLL